MIALSPSCENCLQKDDEADSNLKVNEALALFLEGKMTKSQ